MDFYTKNVHYSKKSKDQIHSKVTPIYQTSAFTFRSLEELEGYYEGQGNYLYSRVGNPNTDELGQGVAALEGADAGVATSSGLSAVLVSILSVAHAGDHIIANDDLYGGTFQLIAKELQEVGVEASFVSFENKQEIVAAIRPNTKVIYSESVTNPLLRVENLKQVVEIAKEYNLVSIIDNTFATPFLCKPLEVGVDLVVHSATKYIGGHSDVTAGVVVGSSALMDRVTQKVVNLGANLSPFESWLACRGLKTLSIRMERQSHNAEELAKGLDGYRGVKKVYYPTGLSPLGNGAMVSIELDSSLCDVNTFFSSLGWIKIVPTLAGIETTVSYPIATSHRALSQESLDELGITRGLVRISVGIENDQDIVSAFRQAIDQSLQK
ncbi:trans-sulfuration enzyme family protein [Bacillus suaedaesalsae]|uniref:Aminotransferase class I/II-fold pyridoxal phosphate-dependent enzyme n=1 Tax=Bacillus suaedaesalsae TaxID=2810349 RepID=A0ABS2DKT9_9BACI|nr:aminotransferase class I/II-fold pyridoxal phosphate-dependent enzyme [Bacillus suaedaesalsae]MBM6618645.1 aminotransferase class I/II-fold pyridoxal phosphate-dependent enzyme [Bacillus suaedaesalsae]